VPRSAVRRAHTADPDRRVRDGRGHAADDSARRCLREGGSAAAVAPEACNLVAILAPTDAGLGRVIVNSSRVPRCAFAAR